MTALSPTLAAATRLMHNAYEQGLAGRQQREIDVQEVAGGYVLLADVATRALEPLRLAHIYALKGTPFKGDLGEGFKPWKWDGCEREYAEGACAAYRALLAALSAAGAATDQGGGT